MQVMEEKQRKLEERKVMKSSTNYLSEEGMKKNVTGEIEIRLQENEAKEKARKNWGET